jgi:hypothetical protein
MIKLSKASKLKKYKLSAIGKDNSNPSSCKNRKETLSTKLCPFSSSKRKSEIKISKRSLSFCVKMNIKRLPISIQTRYCKAMCMETVQRHQLQGFSAFLKGKRCQLHTK